MPEKTRIRPPIIELALARTKEFLREKEAMFWVFGFPLILALALGFAFREKPPDRVPVAIVAGPNAQQRLAALQKSSTLLGIGSGHNGHRNAVGWLLTEGKPEC